MSMLQPSDIERAELPQTSAAYIADLEARVEELEKFVDFAASRYQSGWPDHCMRIVSRARKLTLGTRHPQKRIEGHLVGEFLRNLLDPGVDLVWLGVSLSHDGPLGEGNEKNPITWVAEAIFMTKFGEYSCQYEVSNRFVQDLEMSVERMIATKLSIKVKNAVHRKA